MSVKVVRVRSGEDVITDIKEISTTEESPEQRKVIGYQLDFPCTVWVSQPITAEDDDGNIHKISNPEITMEPWMALSKDQVIIVRPDEIVSAYDTFPEILERYTQLVEARNGVGSEDSPIAERESE
jgi:hypothetical protein